MNDQLRDILLFIAGLVLIVILAGLLGGFIGYDQGKRDAAVVIRTDTMVITTVDTCVIPSPPDTVIDTKIKYVPVPKYVTKTDTIVDSIMVPLPFERHFAKLGDVADVYFSGYEAKIDSAITYRHHTTEIIYHTIQESSPKNMITVTAGAVDASAGYMHRFGRLWLGASAGYTYDGIPTVRGTIGYQF